MEAGCCALLLQEMGLSCMQGLDATFTGFAASCGDTRGRVGDSCLLSLKHVLRDEPEARRAKSSTSSSGGAAWYSSRLEDPLSRVVYRSAYDPLSTSSHRRLQAFRINTLQPAWKVSNVIRRVDFCNHERIGEND